MINVIDEDCNSFLGVHTTTDEGDQHVMASSIRRSSSTVFKTFNKESEGELRLTGHHSLLLAILERALLDIHAHFHPGHQIQPPYLSHRNVPNRLLRQTKFLKDAKVYQRSGLYKHTRLDGLNAENWVSSDTTEPFSFLWLCEHLFAEPMYMADVIRKYCARLKREYTLCYDPKRKTRNKAKLDEIFNSPTDTFVAG